jgi:hypothetical protein
MHIMFSRVAALIFAVGCSVFAQDVISPAPGGAPRKFSSIPVLERSALLMEIRKQDSVAILQLWMDAGRIDHDLMKQGALATLLSYAIRERPPNPDLLARMKALLGDNANPAQDRTGVLGILAAAATKESVDLLLSAATTLPDEQLRGIAISAVSQAGKAEGAGPELTPALEKIWRQSSDQRLLFSVAEAMAKIGGASSVELLLSAALSENGTSDAQKGAAQSALPDIYKRTAVPALAARLSGLSPASENSQLAAPLLVRIGDTTGAKAVVTWLQGTVEDATPLIRERLLKETRTPAMLVAWEAALDHAVTFRNERNREAIRAGLEEYKAGIKHEMP